MAKWSRGAWSFFFLILLALVFVLIAPPEKGPLHLAFSPSVYALSRHHAVAGRLDELLDSPVGQALLQLADEEVDAGTRFWIKELIPKEAQFGYEPFLGAERTPGWVGVSPVGARHMRLRALLDWVTLKRYERHGEHNGRNLWTRKKEGRTRMTLALASGVLLVCIHEDADAIREVLDRLDGRRPSVAADVFPDSWDSDQVLLRSHFLGSPEIRMDLEAATDSELTLQIKGPFSFSEEEGLHGMATRFGGPATLAMLRLPALPGYGLYGESVVLLTGTPFQGGLALFGVPALQIMQAWDETWGQTEAMQAHFRAVLERESGRRWQSAPVENGMRLMPEDAALRRFLRGGHVPGALWSNEVLVYTSSLLATENLFRRLTRAGEVAFELRQLRWIDPTLVFWMDGKRLSEELAFLGQILGAFFTGEEQDLPDVPRILAGLAKLEITAFRVESHTVRLRISARP